MVEDMTPLVPFETYEQHAVHIGTNQKSADMKELKQSVKNIKQQFKGPKTPPRFLNTYLARLLTRFLARVWRRE